MDKEWVSVLITTNEFGAELAKGLLEDNEIDCVLINRKDSFYHFGELELFVKRQNVIKAKYLLKEL